ncbi:MAG: cytochrome c oxidase subunit 4 [Actinomycetota bacterium]|nr:cytochrome c oxidase subunit 4 [Actinomycetota bacterium]
MKFEWKLIIGSAVFLGIVYAVYWFTSYEDAGSVMLLFGGCAYLMLGSFLLLQWRRRKNILRPEDDNQAEHEDSAGELGFFPSASIWPAGIGLGAIFIGLALIWGNWYLVIGLPLLLGSIIGFSVEAEAGFDAVEEVELAEAAAAEREASRPGEDGPAHPEGDPDKLRT